MVRLCRTIRFAVSDAVEDHAATAADDPNGYAARPAMRGLGRHYELDIVCAGEVDPRTGYFLDIKSIDRAARDSALPIISRACRETPTQDPALLLPEIFRALDKPLEQRLHSVRWRLSPTYSVETRRDTMHETLLRQRFEFAASHRLHVAELSDEENRRLFGKCNLPSGHGHNYVVEPAVAVRNGRDATGFSLQDLERLTDDLVISRFDHRHLNLDIEEFGDGALNPSVENIARVCFGLLEGPVAQRGARLVAVTVWETEKTCATYPA